MNTTPQIENRKSKIENPFLPPGALTLLIGDPGIGKSLLALDIAARLSRGLPPFPAPSVPQSLTASVPPATPPLTSLVSSAEDSTGTLLARFNAAAGSLNHVYFLDPSLTLSPKSDAPQLLAFLSVALPKLQKSRNSPALLVLDPLPHFLGTFDCSHAASVRRVLTPLLRLANEHHFSILGITHLNKSTKLKSSLHRTISSIAYVALARSVLLLTPDDEDPTRQQKLLIPIKSNLSHPTHALAFTITTTPPPPSPVAAAAAVNPSPTEGPLSSTPPAPIIQYNPTPITNHPLLNGQPLTQQSDPFTKSQLELAEHFLRTTLATGPLPSSQLLKESRTLALSPRTLHRARQNLNVDCYFDNTTMQWLCALPTGAKPDTPSAGENDRSPSPRL